MTQPPYEPPPPYGAQPPYGAPPPPPPPPQPYSYGYGGYGGQQPYPAPPAPKPTNWWAIISLIFGVLGGVLISVVCGIVGLNRAKQGQGGRGMAIAGLVLSALWVVAVVAGIALFVAFKDKLPTNAADIAIGDCLSEVPSDESLVSSVKTVPCTDPHKGEVYAVITVPGTDFPGQAAIVDQQDKCEPALQAYSTSAYEDPDVGMFVLYPTADSWKRGDRAITCIATTDDARSGSLKG